MHRWILCLTRILTKQKMNRLSLCFIDGLDNMSSLFIYDQLIVCLLAHSRIWTDIVLSVIYKTANDFEEALIVRVSVWMNVCGCLINQKPHIFYKHLIKKTTNLLSNIVHTLIWWCSFLLAFFAQLFQNLILPEGS